MGHYGFGPLHFQMDLFIWTSRSNNVSQIHPLSTCMSVSVCTSLLSALLLRLYCVMLLYMLLSCCVTAAVCRHLELLHLCIYWLCSHLLTVGFVNDLVQVCSLLVRTASFLYFKLQVSFCMISTEIRVCESCISYMH